MSPSDQRPAPRSSAWTRHAFDSAAIALATVDREGLHQAANAAYLTLTGRTRGTTLHQPLMGLVATSGQDGITRWLADPHQAWSGELEVDRPGLEPLAVMAWINPLPFGSGDHHAVVQLVPSEITHHGATASARVRAVSDLITDSLLFVDADLAVVHYNDAAAAALDQDALANVTELVHAEDWGDLTELLRTARGRRVATAARVRTADGWTEMALDIEELRDQTDHLLGTAWLLRQETVPAPTTRASLAAVQGLGSNDPAVAMLAHTSCALWAFDDTGPVAASAGARALLGASAAEDVSAVVLHDIVPEWAAARLVDDAFAAAARDGEWTGALAALDAEGDEIEASIRLVFTAATEPGSMRWLFEITPTPSAAAREVERSLRDELTGLPNEVGLRDRIEMAVARAERSRSRVGLAILRLDGTDELLEAVGAEYLDRIVAGTAARLAASVRPGDTLARHDETSFAVLRDEVSDLRDGQRWAERVRAALDEPLLVDGVAWFVTLSAGSALTQPGVTGAEGLLRNALSAVDRATELGSGRTVVFGQALREAAGRHTSPAPVRRPHQMRRSPDAGGRSS